MLKEIREREKKPPLNIQSVIYFGEQDRVKLLALIDRAREIIGYYYAETESEEAWRFLKDTEE